MKKTLLSLWLVVASVYADVAKAHIVAFAQDTMGNDWRIAQVEEFKAGLEKHPDITFIHTDAKGKTALQLKHIEDLFARGIDVLVTSPMDAKMLSPVIAKVYRAGIPVVLLTRTVEGSEYTTFIHPKDYDIGEKAAAYIASRLGHSGTVLMIKGVPTASTAIGRTNGFYDEIKHYPGIKVIEKTGNYLRADAIKAVEAVLKEKHSFDAIYCQSDSMVEGVVMAMKKHGLEPKKYVIVGTDYISKGREMIRDGDLDATFLYPTAGKEGAEAVIKILEGKKVPKEIIIDSQMITKKNVEKVEPIF